MIRQQSPVERVTLARVKQGQSPASIRAEFTDVIREGATARDNSLPMSACPYHEGSDAAIFWTSGYERAMREEAS